MILQIWCVVLVFLQKIVSILAKQLKKKVFLTTSKAQLTLCGFGHKKTSSETNFENPKRFL